MGKSIKPDTELTGTTDDKKPSTKASAAAGSESQLPHLGNEMKPDPDVHLRPTKQSMVQVTPFQVLLTRLTQQQIEKYTKQPKTLSVRTPKNTDTSDQTLRSSPVRTCLMTTKTRKSAHKRRLVSGQPSKLLAPNYMFQVHRHILRKHQCCIYIKCRVKLRLMSLLIELKILTCTTSFITLTHFISVVNARKLFILQALGDSINIVNVLNYINVMIAASISYSGVP